MLQIKTRTLYDSAHLDLAAILPLGFPNNAPGTKNRKELHKKLRLAWVVPRSQWLPMTGSGRYLKKPRLSGLPLRIASVIA